MFIKIETEWYEISLKEGAKDIGSRREWSQDKEIVAAFLHALKPGVDKRAYDRAYHKWKRAKEKYRAEFQDLVAKLGTGELTLTQFQHRTRRLFKDMYETAYRLGTDAGGLEDLELPDEDLRWLERVRKAEYVFLAGFAADILRRRGAMNYQDRANMYIDTSESMFHAGRVGAYPDEGTSVYWNLGIAEHCDDCVDLSMQSPFTPRTLPTTPKAGGTQCLSNCRCSLQVRYERPSRIAIAMQRVSPRRRRELGLSDIGITTAMLTKVARGDRQAVDKMRQILGPMDSVVRDIDGTKQQWLDWNVVDELVGVISEKKVMKRLVLEERMDKSRLMETGLRCNDAREALSYGIPEWLDPTSDKDLMIWHGIGITLKDELKYVEMNNIEGREEYARD